MLVDRSLKLPKKARDVPMRLKQCSKGVTSRLGVQFSNWSASKSAIST